MNKLTEKIPDFAPDGPIDSKNKSKVFPHYSPQGA